MAAVKEAQGAAVGDNNNADAVKKRGPKKGTQIKANGASKRKRGKNNEEFNQESEISDDGERELKKAKVEMPSEEEKDVKLEADEV